MTSSDFDWDDDAECIVIPEQAAVAVYRNPAGNVVIRQAGQFGPEEDAFVVVNPRHLETLGRALLKEAGGDRASVPAPHKSKAPLSPRSARTNGNGSAPHSDPLLLPYSGESETLPLG